MSNCPAPESCRQIFFHLGTAISSHAVNLYFKALLLQIRIPSINFLKSFFWFESFRLSD